MIVFRQATMPQLRLQLLQPTILRAFTTRQFRDPLHSALAAACPNELLALKAQRQFFGRNAGDEGFGLEMPHEAEVAATNRRKK